MQLKASPLQGERKIALFHPLLSLLLAISEETFLREGYVYDVLL
ncbi:MAG: hypothetical protein QXJ59_07850 [Thermofilaceae archaeon]